MKVNITPSRASGTVTAPPSKSFAHRALIAAALSEGESAVDGICESEDMNATLDCLRVLGADCERKLPGIVTVKGIERGGTAASALYPCRESGSTLRFLIPIALACGENPRFTGSERLMARGVGVYEELFCSKGMSFEKTGNELCITGRLKPGDYTLRGDISSQFVTGLMFALPLLDGDSRLTVLEPVESRAYIDITLETLKNSGIAIEKTAKYTYCVPGNQHYRAGNVTVEGDWSNAAFLYALNALGGNIKIEGLNEQSVQGDRVCRELLERLKRPGSIINISDCPDLGPVLFAAAAALHGARFEGTRRLKIKESDRASAMAQELEKLGVRLSVCDNSVTVPNMPLHAPICELDGHNDHRIVMTLAVLCCLTGGKISGAEAVSKSWREFFATLQKLGTKIQFDD